MADYLIQDSTLTDIADAIRAKDGSSAPILTEDMADAIAAIPTGGGGGWELIADYTSDADATIVEVAIPENKKGLSFYKIEITTEFTSVDYPYIGLDGSYGGYQSATARQNELTVYSGAIVRRKKSVNGIVQSDQYYAIVGGIASNNVDAPFSTLNFKSYYENHIKAGCNIKIWGVVE